MAINGRKDRMREPYTVHTFGYASRTIDRLDSEVNRLSAVIVDVRIQPYDRIDHDFDRPALQARYGSKYVWMREFGNKHSKTNGATDFVNLDLGARRLGAIVADGTSVIFLCSCKSHDGCHRAELANLFNDQLGWKVSHLPQDDAVPLIESLFAE